MKYLFFSFRIFVAGLLMLMVTDLSAQRFRSFLHKGKIAQSFLYDEDEPTGDSLRGFSFGLNLVIRWEEATLSHTNDGAICAS